MATPSRIAGKASIIKPAPTRPATAKPTVTKPATRVAARAPVAVSKPGVAGKVDPTKPKAAQSDWLVFLKLSGGPFPKEVKEAKIADCKQKFDTMKEENNEEYLDL